MIDIQNFTPLYNVFYLYLLTSEKNINTEIAAFIAEGKKTFPCYTPIYVGGAVYNNIYSGRVLKVTQSQIQ